MTARLKSLRAAAATLLLAALPASSPAEQADPGKAILARIKVTVLYATDADPAKAGDQATAVPEEVEKRLRGDERLRFQHYRTLGEDTQPLLRSYENWAQPLKPSEEILVRFEARSRPTRESARMDMELWLSRQKTLKTDALLETGRPLYILGPEWREGRLIIAVERVPRPSPAP
jgi:hypothetical protein